MFFLKSKEIPLSEFFPKGFVDIHSHLLFGIDDGAKDLEDALSMIQKMAANGIQDFITTPHILGDLYPNTPTIIHNKLKAVQNALSQHHLEHIRITAAAEYMMDEQFSALLEKDELLPLKGKYVLVEMSYFSPPLNLYDILFQIQLKGYKPVLAHPERYFSYHNKIQAYHKLKRTGCLFQLNLLSLTPHYGKNVQKTARLLLKENLYDFVGTDAHHHLHLELLEKVATKANHKLLETLLAQNKAFFGF